VQTEENLPDPARTAEEVVRIQLQAMRDNDSPEPDSGIATAFAFASPANKAQTGPLGRFTPMVHSALYKALLNYKSAQMGPMTVQGDAAEQSVLLLDAEGRTAVFVFTLSRQTREPFAGCWMTDGVTRR